MGSIWDAMARHAVHRKRAREQQQRSRDVILQEQAHERRRVENVTHRTERAEQARDLRARQEADAARFDAQLKAECDRLTGLLRAAAAESARDLAHFRRALPQERPPTVDDVVAPPRPQWSQYAPAPPGLFGRRRYERAVVAARAELDDALARHDRALESALTELTRKYEIRTAQ